MKLVKKYDAQGGMGMDYILNRLEKTYAEEYFDAEDSRGLVDAAIQMVRIEKMARREGLLSLISLLNDPDFSEYIEEYCNKYQVSLLNMESFDAYLCFLLEKITMGVDRADIRKMGLLTMSTSCFSGYQFVKYAIWLEGVLAIQAGAHPLTLRDLLAVYLPAEARKTFMEETANE